MEFSTKVQISSNPDKLSVKDRILLIGSCFSDNVGQKLSEDKLDVLSNPFGVIYNPISIFKVLILSVKNDASTFELFEKNGLYFSPNVHSELYGSSKEELTDILLQQTQLTHQYLKTAKQLIITLGTAVVYEYKSNGCIVANCHKLPSALFNKRILETEEVIRYFEEFYTLLKTLNPACKILFTVSPVRHIKDTLPTNSVSKSVLLVAINTITNRYPETGYFPSYEIQIDELRDYRFYKEDMIHPNWQAIQYIYDAFKGYNFDEKTIKILQQWGKLRQSLQHRSLFPESEEHKKFKQQLLSELQKMASELQLGKEIAELKKELGVS